MKMKHLIKLRKALKDENSSKKLVDEIQNEIAINDRQYKERDKELKDLLKIISASQEIIESTDK
jgi:hypothetical protein